MRSITHMSAISACLVEFVGIRSSLVYIYFQAPLAALYYESMVHEVGDAEERDMIQWAAE